MNKNVIIIENLRTGRVVIPVENFSDANVKEAISKNLHNDIIHSVSDLQCLSADTSGFIYAVKNACPAIKENIGTTSPFYYDSENPCCLLIDTATLIM